MKYLLKYIMACLLLTGCGAEGMMEDTDLDAKNVDKVYSNVTYTRQVLFDLYGRMRDINKNNSGSFSRLMDMNTTVAMLDNATDDGAGNTTRTGGIVPGIQRYVTAAITSTTSPIVGTHPWTWYYKAIRNANTFIANVDRSPLSDEEKLSSKNEARFLRALYYHELFRWFGELIITETETDPLDFDTPKRETLETTVKWIVKEFDDLSKDGVLPDRYEDAEYGRPTRGAALAYKARTLLYAASPLHKASNVTWAEAAEAAYDMIDYCDGGGWYALYIDEATPEKSYTYMFNKRDNSEYIMQYLRADNNDLYNMMPSINPWNKNKELTTCPTQWLVDSYDMLDGTEPILGYTANYEPIINADAGYDDQNPYKDRDPRLDQSIMHHGTIWPKVATKEETIDLRTPEKWGSGYFLSKYLDDRIDHYKEKTSMNFPMMRYAEVLLNFAEAKNEAEDSQVAREAAVVQLNRIRERAGITGTLEAQDYDQTTLRERIRKERRVELCFEEHRFFDIRRWKIAKSVMSKPATGISIINGLYVRKTLDNRSYNERMNLSPIPRSEVNNCPQVHQNPGY